MTKNCEICGGSFEAVAKTRKYCDKCGKNSKLAQARLDSAIRDNKYRMDEMPGQYIQHGECKQCGKPFVSYSGRPYCSDICKTQYLIENARCRVCGVQLLPLGIESMNGSGICSDECREKSKWVRAREKGNVINCKQCNKEFIRKSMSNEFCSNDCYKEFKAKEIAGRINAPTVPPIVKDNCVICGKEFERHRNATVYTCGKECSLARQKERAEKAKQEKHQKNYKPQKV